MARSAASVAALGTMPLAMAQRPGKLKILILGGTGFLGPHTVRAALARGHEMTLFNRGRTNTHLFPELEKLKGDRDPDKDAGLSALKGRSWDAVIDTSGYVPRIVRSSAELLADARIYVFISTISVYPDRRVIDMDETAPVGTIKDETTERVTGRSYGPLKALCEKAAEHAMPGRVAAIRPGLIVGPGDTSDRFTYWPVRVARGGEVLSPGMPRHYVQFIDVRDLAEFIILSIERNIVGTYNATSPSRERTIGGLLDTCKSASNSDATFTWADADFLEAHHVSPWQNMPVWAPPVGDYVAFGQVSSAKASAAGLTHRPLAETVRDTLDWHETRPADQREGWGEGRKPGLTAEREAEVLKAWHEKYG
jgi:2'-hydroxyisoflavone reductase